MLHFLPEQNMKAMRVEYMCRVAVYALLFIFCATFLLIALFLPSVIFSAFNRSTAENQLASVTAENKAAGIDPTQIIGSTNGMIKIFSDELASSTLASGIIANMLSLKNSNVVVNSISMTETSGVQTYVIEGVAATRDDLTSFDNALLADTLFASVNLPVSDLINDTNDAFTITLTYDYTTFQ